MADGRGRRVILAAVLLAIVAFVVWLALSPPRVVSTAPPEAPAPVAVEATPRVPRPRDVAAPPATDAPPATPADVAPPPKAAPTFPLEVTVIRGDGTPAAGASVLLVDPNPDDDADNVVGRATADARGVATLRAPEFVFRVAAWLGAEASTTDGVIAAQERPAVTVRLSTAMIVRGRVLRGDVPEAGADVELSMVPWFGSDFEFALRTKSDAEGRYEFPPIPRAGVHPLNPPFVDATTKDMARGYATADMERPDAAVDVQLTPGFTLRGRLLDPAGHDAPAELWVVGSRTRKFHLDSDGRFVARLAEGRLRFVASFATHSSYIADFDVEVASPPMIEDPILRTWFCARVVGRRDDGASGDVDLGDIVLQPGKPVAGVVVNPSGEVAPRASATLFLGDILLGTVVADAEGRFEFPEVSEEAHRVAFRSDVEGRAGRASVENVHGGDPELRVVLAVPDVLTVKLLLLAEGTRTPVKSREIRVKAWRHGEEHTCAETQCMATTTEDAMDEFSFDVPDAGSFDVEVIVGGYEPHRFESVEVAAGRGAVLDLLLRKKAD